jgi:protein TonB
MRRHRIAIALGVVILVHAGLLAWTFAARDRIVERPPESRTITAEFLSAPPHPVVPQTVVQPAPPQPAVPAAHPKLPARTRPLAKAALAPVRAPQPESATPLPIVPSAPAAPAPPVTASAPAIERPSLALSGPKNVSHVDCNLAKPDYPDISKRRGENGTAIVGFVVGLTGRIEDVHLQKSSGHPRLDEAALDAIHTSACQPYKENGTAIRAAYEQPFVFGLTD